MISDGVCLRDRGRRGRELCFGIVFIVRSAARFTIRFHLWQSSVTLIFGLGSIRGGFSK